MATLSAKGIHALLPPGFEGRIYQRADVGGAQAYPVAQFATFPLPADIADFGGGAPVAMAPTDLFVVLFEYGPESLGTALFARPTMPRNLSPDDFHPYVLRRGAPGQSGTQWFFTENRRPFTLYAVLGSHARRAALVLTLNGLLNQISIYTVGVGSGVVT